MSNWGLDRDGYATSNSHINNGKYIKLHRYIMLLENSLIDNLEVDHKDRNKLNNVASNLRMATSQEQKRNQGKKIGFSSQYIGVSWYKRDDKWRAKIKHNNKNIHIGMFDNEVEAAQAYDESLANIPIDESFKVYNFPN